MTSAYEIYSKYASYYKSVLRFAKYATREARDNFLKAKGEQIYYFVDSAIAYVACKPAENSRFFDMFSDDRPTKFSNIDEIDQRLTEERLKSPRSFLDAIEAINNLIDSDKKLLALWSHRKEFSTCYENHFNGVFSKSGLSKGVFGLAQLKEFVSNSERQYKARKKENKLNDQEHLLFLVGLVGLIYNQKLIGAVRLRRFGMQVPTAYPEDIPTYGDINFDHFERSKNDWASWIKKKRPFDPDENSEHQIELEKYNERIEADAYALALVTALNSNFLKKSQFHEHASGVYKGKRHVFVTPSSTMHQAYEDWFRAEREANRHHFYGLRHPAQYTDKVHALSHHISALYGQAEQSPSEFESLWSDLGIRDMFFRDEDQRRELFYLADELNNKIQPYLYRHYTIEMLDTIIAQWDEVNDTDKEKISLEIIPRVISEIDEAERNAYSISVTQADPLVNRLKQEINRAEAYNIIIQSKFKSNAKDIELFNYLIGIFIHLVSKFDTSTRWVSRIPISHFSDFGSIAKAVLKNDGENPHTKKTSIKKVKPVRAGENVSGESFVDERSVFRRCDLDVCFQAFLDKVKHTENRNSRDRGNYRATLISDLFDVLNDLPRPKLRLFMAYFASGLGSWRQAMEFCRQAQGDLDGVQEASPALTEREKIFVKADIAFLRAQCLRMEPPNADPSDTDTDRDTVDGFISELSRYADFDPLTLTDTDGFKTDDDLRVAFAQAVSIRANAELAAYYNQRVSTAALTNADLTKVCEIARMGREKIEVVAKNFPMASSLQGSLGENDNVHAAIFEEVVDTAKKQTLVNVYYNYLIYYFNSGAFDRSGSATLSDECLRNMKALKQIGEEHLAIAERMFVLPDDNRIPEAVWTTALWGLLEIKRKSKHVGDQSAEIANIAKQIRERVNEQISRNAPTRSESLNSASTGSGQSDTETYDSVLIAFLAQRLHHLDEPAQSGSKS